MFLYYYEIHSDKYLYAPDYQSSGICHFFGNAKFFDNKKAAKLWYDSYKNLYPEAKLTRFEPINFLYVDEV